MSITVVSGVVLGYVLEKEDFLGQRKVHGCSHKENKHPFYPQCGKPAKIEETYRKVSEEDSTKTFKVHNLYQRDRIEQIVVGYPMTNDLGLYKEMTSSFTPVSEEEYRKIKEDINEKLKEFGIQAKSKNFGYKHWLYVS